MMKKDIPAYLCEFLGTAFLVFFAAGAVMISGILDGLPAALVGGISSGLILMTVIWVFGDVSGGHVNPALTVVLALTRQFPARLVPGYVVSQLAGSVAGAAVLFAALGSTADMGANLPNLARGISPTGALAIEVLLSFIMMMVIQGALSARGRIREFAAVPIGAIVGLEVMLMGGVAGAAMNPARAFGPYVFRGDFDFLWIYCVGPLLGISLGAVSWRYLHRSD